MNRMIVMKFGGSSVGTPDAMRQAARLIAAHAARAPVVAVSALQGVTDQLLAAAEAAARGDASWKDALEDVRRRHFAQAEAFGAAPPAIEALLRGCEAALAAVAAERAVRPERQDEIVS